MDNLTLRRVRSFFGKEGGKRGLKMEKRTVERLQSGIDARFTYGDMFYSGTILNLSEKGMFIRTKICLPPGAMFVVMVREDNELLKMLARVKYSLRSRGHYEGMGVKILNPPTNYKEYVDKLRPVHVY
jgi:hypothetical protein